MSVQLDFSATMKISHSSNLHSTLSNERMKARVYINEQTAMSALIIINLQTVSLEGN